MVRLLKYPLPFRAALAVCSDPDSIVSEDEFLAFHWLTESALGLRISDSLFLRSKIAVSLLGSDGRVRPRLKQLCRDDVVDALHCYAELQDEPADASDLAGALKVIESEGLRLSVWTNHSHSPFNLESGQGDLDGSPFHHAPRLRAHGVRFISTGAITPIWGQDRRFRAADIVEVMRFGGNDSGRVLALARHLVKIASGRCVRRFQCYAGNRLLHVKRLRDGTRFWAFPRYGRHLGKWGRFKHLAEILSGPRLDRLIQSRSAVVIYSHLGKKNPGNDFSNQQDVERTFRPLADRADRIWVCGTAQLLRYWVTREHLDWYYHSRSRTVELRGVNDPVTGPRAATAQDLRGLSFASRCGNLAFHGLDGVEVTRLEKSGLTIHLLS